MNYTHYVTNWAGSWVYVGGEADCHIRADLLNTEYQTDGYRVFEA